MTTPLIESIEELEAQFQTSIPCNKCGQPATLRSIGHGQCPDPDGSVPPFFKCDRCFVKWYAQAEMKLHMAGHLIHSGCKQKFDRIEDLSDYREF